MSEYENGAERTNREPISQSVVELAASAGAAIDHQRPDRRLAAERGHSRCRSPSLPIVGGNTHTGFSATDTDTTATNAGTADSDARATNARTANTNAGAANSDAGTANGDTRGTVTYARTTAGDARACTARSHADHGGDSA